MLLPCELHSEITILLATSYWWKCNDAGRSDISPASAMAGDSLSRLVDKSLSTGASEIAVGVMEKWSISGWERNKGQGGSRSDSKGT